MPGGPITAKAVREAAFKYNGVPDFCEFLAALPANVSVFDPKLGRIRTLVEGSRVIPKNVTWLRKRPASPYETKQPNPRLSRRTRRRGLQGFDQPLGRRQRSGWQSEIGCV